MWCLSVVVVLVIINGIQSQSDATCKTPSGSDGTCINLKTCEPLVAIFKKPQPYPPEDLDLLQKSRCGFEGRTPKVCCPKATPLTSLDPPDVSEHPNLKLVNPERCGLSLYGKIYGGNKTGVLEFPWMALIAYRKGNQLKFGCGGTLINDRYILTAAHCLTDLGDRTLAGVRLGEHNTETKQDCEKLSKDKERCAPPVQDFRIEETIFHPEYTRAALKHDVGLIRINKKPKYVQNVQAICLPVGDLRFFKQEVGVVAGWGTTENGGASPELLKVNLPIVKQEQCAEIYKSVTTIVHTQLCAGGNLSDSCGGDSGGPNMYPNVVHEDSRYVQNGIVSFGPTQCGTFGRPGVYTRVAYYMDWILDNMMPF